MNLFQICVIMLASSHANGLGTQTGSQDHGKFGVWFRSSKGVNVRDDDDEKVPVLERAGDPARKKSALLSISSRPFSAIFGHYASVQVNVNAAGKNIVGDAANEPTIAVSPLDPKRIVVGWRQFDDVTSNFRQAGNAYSTDGGKTWHNNPVITPGTFRSDPVLAVDSSGTFFYNSLLETFYTDVFESLTKGVSWPLVGPAMGGDKQWMVVDATNGVGKGNLYETWSTAGNNYNGNQFSRSTDGGNTWLDPINLPGYPVWGTMDVAPNGDLYVGALGDSAFEFLRSSNAQIALQTPTFDIQSSVDLGGGIVYGSAINPEGLMGQCWIATDKSSGAYSGNIYVLCSVGVDGNNPCDVNLARSSDGGNTWSPYVRVNDDAPNKGASHWFGTLSVAPNGRIDVCWYDNRANPALPNSALFITSSYNGGATWLTSKQASPSFDPTVGYPNQSKIGDYIGMVSDVSGSSIAYSATFNGEEDIWFLRAPVIATQPMNATTVAARLGAHVSGVVTDIWKHDGRDYVIESQSASGLGQAAAAQIEYRLPLRSAGAVSVRIAANAVPGAAGALWVFDWKSMTYVNPQRFTFDAVGASSQTINFNNISPSYFDAAGRVRVLIQASAPAARPFPFKIDLMQLVVG